MEKSNVEQLDQQAVPNTDALIKIIRSAPHKDVVAAFVKIMETEDNYESYIKLAALIRAIRGMTPEEWSLQAV